MVHDGKQIDSDTYKILINTAETFGIDQYKIVWSDTPIEYAYTDPGLYYCMKNGISYGYGVQVAPSEDISTLCPEMKKLVQAEYKQNEFICYRPIIDDDNKANVLEGFDVTDSAYKNSTGIVVMAINEGTDFQGNIEYNVFSSSNWYLVPIEGNEQEIYELNYKETYDLTQTVVEEPKYWFTNTELSPGDKTMPKERFYEFIATAEMLGLENMKFVNSNDIQHYGFAPGLLAFSVSEYKGDAQIIPATDLLIVEPDLLEQYLDAGYTESSAQLRVADDTNPEVHPYYAWIPKELLIIDNDSTSDDHRDIYVFNDVTYELQITINNDLWWMIPTDESGNEILKVWYPLGE